jgi:uncharacterized membrane protein
MISYFTYLRDTLPVTPRPTSKKTAWILGGILIAFIGLVLPFQLMRLWIFHFTVNDLGTFSQILWAVANGQAPITTSSYPFLENQHWLGFHFSLFQFILAPFYRQFNYAPEFLGVIHVCSFALAAVPIFYTIRAWFKDDAIPLMWTAIFLFNPITLTAASFSFQDHTFAVPLIALGFWALVYKRFHIFVGSMICLALCKEHFGVDVAGFGILWAWYHKEWKRGLLVSLCGFIYFVLVMTVFMPAFNTGNAMMPDFTALTTKQKIYTVNRYGWMKLPWPDNLGMGLYILTSPGVINYLTYLFFPTFWLSLLSPIFLLSAIGDLAANTLSWSEAPRDLTFYHSSTILPGITISCAVTSLLLTRLFKLRYLNLVIAIFILLRVGYYAEKRIEMAWKLVQMQPPSGLSWALEPKFKKLYSVIPDDAKLTGLPGAVTFFSSRASFFPPLETERANMALYRLTQPVRRPGGPAVAEAFLTQTGTIKSLLDSNEWTVTYWDDPWLILEKKPATAFHKANVAAINKRLEQLRQENIEYNLPKYVVPTRK